MTTAATRITIGVAGGTGSGKTTIAREIVNRVSADRVAYFAHDSYYRDASDMPRMEHNRINFDHPDSLETELLIKHIRELQHGHAINMPQYDFTTDSRSPHTKRVEPKPVILVEGILVLADKDLRELLDLKIYVDTDADLRFIRRLTRDVHERKRELESVIEQYLTTVRPMHLEFVEPSKRYADLIIPEGGYNTVALDVVVARVRAQLLESNGP